MKLSQFSTIPHEDFQNEEPKEENQYMKLIGALDMRVFIYTSFVHTAFREGGFTALQTLLLLSPVCVCLCV